jgi:predicted nucleic acid-binding protein
LTPTDDLVSEANRLSWSLDHPIYDCLYIALALRENSTLVTADAKQFAAARKARALARML